MPDSLKNPSMTTSTPSPPVGSPSLTTSSVSEDDLFEPESLRGLDRTIISGRYANNAIIPPSELDRSPVASDGQDQSFCKDEPLDMFTIASATAEMNREFSAGNMRVDSSSNLNLSSSSSFDSHISSPVGSPRSRLNPDMTEILMELLHLVDSAIMGAKESIERLRQIVTGGDVLATTAVDALLGTMGRVEGLDESGTESRGEVGRAPPSVILNPHAAVVAVELVPWLPLHIDSENSMSPRTRMVKGLLYILMACTRNRAVCSALGLLGAMLQCAERLFVGLDGKMDLDGTTLCQCIQVLAGHSVSVSDLHSWLSLVKKAIATDWALQLMLALEKAIGGKEAHGPACTFEFDGESSGLLGPGESRWPFSNGYGFATWIYIESFEDTLNMPTSGKSAPVSATEESSALAGQGTGHMPRLFSFLSTENLGVEAYFHGQFLVVECGGGRGKKASLQFTYTFQPLNWYFIGLEHTCNKQGLIGKTGSELKLYVDGSLYESHYFEFPRVSKPLAFCCIGTNPPHTMTDLQTWHRWCTLFAEMGPIYIFKEPIGQERMARLAIRGGDTLPSFGNGAGFPCLGVNAEMINIAEESFLLDAEIEGSLHLLYHPNLLSGQFCPDASSSSPSGTIHRSAEVFGKVHVASRIRVTESLWALAYGGPMALLPLTISNIEGDSFEPVLGDLFLSVAAAKLSASILRIMSMSVEYPGNNEELCRTRAPDVLSRVLCYLLQALSTMDVGKEIGSSDEELVAAIISLCQSQKKNYELKVQFLSTLLLDLKTWCICKYSLQKQLLSSLADMVFSDTSAMRDANAVQKLLDGCRMCYWVFQEKDSMNTFSLYDAPRHVGEVNALVDELLVVIELLIGIASPSLAADDICRFIRFLVDCPQPNQVARVLHLIYRLIVQPNASNSHLFAELLISNGGIESLLFLLQRETKAGNDNILGSLEGLKKEVTQIYGLELTTEVKNLDGDLHSHEVKKSQIPGNNLYNAENDDEIVVGIIRLLGALVTTSHLKFNSPISPSIQDNGPTEGGGTMFSDKVSFLLFGLQKAFQAAPQRLMTTNVYMALLGATMNLSSADDSLNLYDSGHRFEHLQFLSVLLHSLRYASRTFQVRVIQDLLFLSCSHSENRSSLTCMEEWPEWLLEVLISNYEMGYMRHLNGPSVGDIEDLILNFLIIVLEHSMQQKYGWKDVEAAIHCAEWLSMVGGSSTGDLRIRREESLPILKRRLFGGLLDFASRELQVQAQDIAAAASSIVAEGLSPQEAKVEAESAAQLCVSLAENTIVILMFVEDHLRLQTQLYISSQSIDGSNSPASLTATSHSNVLNRSAGESADISILKKNSISSDSAGFPLDVLSSMADANGQLPKANVAEPYESNVTEPYKSVRCAFASYGSCNSDLAEGWKYRSRLWYGVGLPSKTDIFGGGGSGWESWKYALEKDSNGKWIELPLVKKSVAMIQALLLNEYDIGGVLGDRGGSGIGMGRMTVMHQLLDSDQPFLCMLRMVLVSMREDDNGENDTFMRNISTKEIISEDSLWQAGNATQIDNHNQISTRKPHSSLVWSVLAPILNTPISESKRQRVLVTSCILYAEIWHAVGMDRKPLRKHYLEGILPPFLSILRRWRPLLLGIHELTSSDGQNPLIVDERLLSADALPLEAAVSMISPGWTAAFASPPAAMALAMIAAGTAGGETVPTVRPPKMPVIKRETSLQVIRMSRLFTFASFQKPPESLKNSPPVPKDKAAAKAAALAAARDLERLAKIGTGRGLSAVAMATSAQRRALTNTNRAKRLSISEAMGTAWMECSQSIDTKSVSGKDFSALSYKYAAILVASLSFARNMQRLEMERWMQVNLLDRHRAYTGSRTWRKLILYLLEMGGLFSAFADWFCNPKQVFWKLDVMESCSRMRRCFKRSYRGSNHSGSTTNYIDAHLQYEPVPSVTPTGSNARITSEIEASLKTTVPSTSVLTKEILMKERKDGYEAVEIDTVGDSVDNDQKSFPATAELSGDFDISPHQNLPQSTSTIPPDYVSGETDERIIIVLSSSIVRPLEVVKGTFQITSKRINFIVDEHNDKSMIKYGIPSTSQKKEQEKNRSWLISSLHQIFSRRYLLRMSALELFMGNRSYFFFDFGSVESCQNAYNAIVQARPPFLNNIYMATQRPDMLLKRTQLMERWSRWEISNFEYLMELNTLAGRSYNDITQYPVFPWILTNYNSSNLDLGDSASYRDLSKPIGALNVDRLRKFQERYSTFEDSVIPKFHYGSHYSNVRSVLYYLVRVEPFTTLTIQLQGGHFEHVDHMFSDIGATWDGIFEDMDDVKELVPELFYLPEVLTNGNSIDFGTTKQGEKIDSVKLPPWAESPVDFIHKHRMALESEHVSAHLHEWIDLIFGYKQRGKEAISAHNVFYYIAYEGTVDIDKITDPVQQRAKQDQITCFGRTPSQLLSIPHLKKQSLSDALHLQSIFRNPNEIKKYVLPNPKRCNVPAAAVSASQDSVIVVDTNAPAANVAMHTWKPNTPSGQGIPFIFQHGGAPENSSGGTFMRIFIGSSNEEWQFPQALAYASSGIRSSSVVAITRDKEIITGGHADNSIKLISTDGAKTIEMAAGHCAPVTCLALSQDSNYLVTGSRDTTIILWRIHCAISSHSSHGPNAHTPSTMSPTIPITGGGIINNPSDDNQRKRIEGPMHVIRGHLGEIVCCCVSSDLGIIASSSYTSGVLLHSLRGRLIRKLDVMEAQAVCLSPQGVVLIWSKNEQKLRTFTVNGIPITTANLQPFSGRIACIEVSVDGESILIGTGSSGETMEFELERDGNKNMILKPCAITTNQIFLPVPSICFINMHTLEVFHSLDFKEGQDITAIALNEDNTNLLVSTADKQMIVFTDPNLSLRVGNLMPSA